MQLDRGIAVGERATTAGVQIGCHRQAVGQDDVVLLQFDVELGHFACRHMMDCVAIQ